MAHSMKWLVAAAGIATAYSIGGTAVYADYPDRAIHLIVGFSPGGGTDVAARLIAPKVSELIGQTIIVENKPGAGGTLGADFVAHSKPDGYTLAFVAAAHTITPSMQKLNYDPVESFAPVIEAVFSPDAIIVNPSSQAKTLKDLLAMAKAKPGALNFGDAGPGTGPYLDMLLLMKETGTKITYVPFKSGNEAAVAIMSGEIETGFSAVGAILGPSRSGKLRPLAVASSQRQVTMPDVPTVAEAAGLKTFEAADADWLGVLAPAGTSREIVNKLNKAFAEAVNMPEIKSRLIESGLAPGPAGDTPEKYKETIKSDIARWAALLKDAPPTK